jgi:hypothetical protein
LAAAHEEGQAAAVLGIKHKTGGEFSDLLHQHRVSPVEMGVEDFEEALWRG